MAFDASGGIPEVLSSCPTIVSAVKEIAEIRKTPALHVMINTLPPGITVPIHRDWLSPTRHQEKHPTVERWHLPVKTNKDASFWGEEDGVQHFELGMWSGPIVYWKKHQIWNLGEEERIHLVVDLDSPERLGEYDP